MRCTIYNVAKRAGVSAMTVSRVLNQRGGVIKISGKTRDKVIAAADELEYTPDLMARGLREGRSRLIGVVVPRVTFSFLPEVIEGMEEIARQRQYSLLLCTTQHDVSLEQEYLRTLRAKQVDGVIIWPSGSEAELADPFSHFLSNGKAVVCIYRRRADKDVTAVTVDWLTAGYLATKHLLDRGHTRIACRRIHPSITDLTPYIDGYKKALIEHGLFFDESLLIPMNNFEQGRTATIELLRRADPPSALFTIGDHIAYGALRGAAEVGAAVPEDFAVVGNNDLEFSVMCRPALTTVRVPKREIGALAAEMILDRCEGKPVVSRQLTPELIVREST